MLITCLKMGMAREEAEKMLRRGWREKRFGPLRLVFDFYVPYYFFTVRVHHGRPESTLFLAGDAVTGTLDPYQFQQPLTAYQDYVTMETARCLRPALTMNDAFQALKEKIQRRILQQGFFRIRELHLSRLDAALYYLPYFSGVYAWKDRARLEIINAWQGTWEGAKLHRIATQWLAAPPPGPDLPKNQPAAPASPADPAHPTC